MKALMIAVMVALGILICPPPPCLDGRLGRLSRDQAITPPEPIESARPA